MMDQEIITTVRYAENRTLTKKRLMMSPVELLLPPELQYLPMWIGMLRWYKCGARSGSVFGYEPTWLIADPTRITKGFWPHGPSPPLWGLFSRTVETLSTRRVWTRAHIGTRALLLGRRRFNGLACHVTATVGVNEVEEARGPVSRGRAWALAPGFPRERRFVRQKRGVSGRFGGRRRFGSERLWYGVCGKEMERLEVLFGWEWVFHEVR